MEKAMTIHMFTCSADSDVYLFTPNKQIPEAAKQYCKGTWNFARQGEWKLGKILVDFQATDLRFAINSAKAMADISSQGFHIARVIIETRVKHEI